MSEKTTKSEERKLATVEQVQQPPAFVDLAQSQASQLVGFSEENAFRFRFPRLGKIHLGQKVKKMIQPKDPKRQPYEAEFPTATDHFVLPPVLVTDQEFRAVLEGIGQNPDAPKVIPVWLPSNKITDNIDSSYNRYSSTQRLICGSRDGITARCTDEQTGEMTEKPCLNRECEFFQSGACVVMHRLRVMLPDAGGIGVFQIDTQSPNNWATLSSEMTSVLGFTGGKLAGIDLYLTLEPEQKLITIEKPGQPPKQMMKDVHLLHLRSGHRLRELRRAAAEVKVDWDMSQVEDVDTSYDDVVAGPYAPDSGDFEVGEPESSEEAVVEGEVVPEPTDADYDPLAPEAEPAAPSEDLKLTPEQTQAEIEAELDNRLRELAQTKKAVFVAVIQRHGFKTSVAGASFDQKVAIREEVEKAVRG